MTVGAIRSGDTAGFAGATVLLVGVQIDAAIAAAIGSAARTLERTIAVVAGETGCTLRRAGTTVIGVAGQVRTQRRAEIRSDLLAQALPIGACRSRDATCLTGAAVPLVGGQIDAAVAATVWTVTATLERAITITAHESWIAGRFAAAAVIGVVRQVGAQSCAKVGRVLGAQALAIGAYRTRDALRFARATKLGIIQQVDTAVTATVGSGTATLELAIAVAADEAQVTCVVAAATVERIVGQVRAVRGAVVGCAPRTCTRVIVAYRAGNTCRLAVSAEIGVIR